MKTNVLGTTSTGLPLIEHRFNHGQNKVLILGGVHGDEIEGVWCSQFLLHELLKNFSWKIDLSLIPMMNPEGVLLRTRTNSRGVDLNRNLPTKDWSPEIKTERYHPGPSPCSELENQVLAQFINEEKPQLIISLHSWHPMLNINGDCRAVAEKIAQMTQYKIDDNIGYPTPGCLGTYAGIERNSPTLTYEIERGLSIDKIKSIHVSAILESLKIMEDK